MYTAAAIQTYRFTCRVFGLTRDVVQGRLPLAEVSVRDVRSRLRQQWLLRRFVGGRLSPDSRLRVVLDGCVDAVPPPSSCQRQLGQLRWSSERFYGPLRRGQQVVAGPSSGNRRREQGPLLRR